MENQIDTSYFTGIKYCHQGKKVMKKVAILHNIMAPYRFPLFNEIAKDKEIDLTVYFMTTITKDRRWKIDTYLDQIKFKYVVLPNIVFKLPIKGETSFIINYTFPLILIKEKFDVVISAGWLDFASHITFIFSKICRFKYVLWSESTINESSWQRMITKLYVRNIVNNASSLICVGKESKEYLKHLNTGQKKDIYVALSTIDTELFNKRSKENYSKKIILKNKFKIPANKTVILYVGQFIPRKGVDVLLEAYNLVKNKNKCLVLLGYGAEIEKYKDIIKSKNIKSVYFLPHMEISELIDVYSFSDIFVLPSREETWGLVVNEAIACKLPVIVSNKVGCAKDLVSQNKNGYVFDHNNPSELTEMLSKLLNSKTLREKFSHESKIILNKIHPKNAALAFKKAIHAA